MHVDVVQGITENPTDPTHALLPNRLEEAETNKNGGARSGKGNIKVRRSNQTVEPPERLGSVP